MNGAASASVAARRTASLVCAVVAVASVLVPVRASDGTPPPRSALVLLSGEAGSPSGIDFATSFHEAFVEASQARTLVSFEYLDLNRFGDRDGYRERTLAWLASKYAGRPPDVIVTHNDNATLAAVELRAALGLDVPIVFAGVGPAAADQVRANPQVTGWILQLDMGRMLDFVRALLPDTRQIVLVGGAGQTDRGRLAQGRAWLKTSARDIEVQVIEGVSLEKLGRQIGALPPDAVVFPVSFLVDPAGEPVDPVLFVKTLRASTSRPLFGLTDITGDDSVVGGVVYSLKEAGRRTAEMTDRVLRASVGSVPVVSVFPTQQVVDARALRRWGISESRVPEGTLVLHAEPSIWREHYGKVLAFSVSLVALTGLVIGLVAERKRRQLAEANARASLNEVSFLNRRAALGELTASIAHEINQPLGAILNNAEAADILLGMDPPPLDEVREAVRAIRDDDQRAGDIVRRLRALLSRGGTERIPVDVRKLITDTLALLRSDALGSHVQFAVDVAGHPVASGDPTQLRQVLLNVCFNGIDAMRAASAGARVLTVSARVDADRVVLAVADHGPGFSPEALERAFEAFYTTKEGRSGMGMGLAITRRIVEAHEGTISVANNQPAPGATVTIVLPAHADE